MSISKTPISSPMEAGTSVLEMKQFPRQLTSALEYISSRLARKHIHLSMIATRMDIEFLPSPPQTQKSQASSPSNSTTSSPARSLFSNASSTVSKTFSTQSGFSCLSPSYIPSTASGTPSSASSFSWSKWPRPFPSLRESLSSVDGRATPAIDDQAQSPTSVNPYGLTILQTTALTLKTERALRRTVYKAEREFDTDLRWLLARPQISKTTCSQTLDLISYSLSQNEVLFDQDGLTLYSVDHLYTFKSALQTYSRSLVPGDLIPAVDALRRLVLCRQGGCISKAELMERYLWLGVSVAALTDINEAYKAAYGGIAQEGGIDLGFHEISSSRTSPKPKCPPKLGLRTNFTLIELRQIPTVLEGFLESSAIKIIGTNTQVERTGAALPTIEEVHVGESARGRDRWGTHSSFAEDKGPHRRGPMTPNGREDITPITKGEWCFLMVGEGWKDGRRGAVETC